jgi:hypothetical protein
MVLDFPNLSIRKAASAIGISPTLAYHIFHDDLHLKPYKLHLWHKLEKKIMKKESSLQIGFLKSLNQWLITSYVVMKHIFI